MGSRGAYLRGEFYEYVAFDNIDNIKILTRAGTDGEHDNTPFHSHTPNTMYAKRDKYGVVDQVAIYKNNMKVKDIDTSGTHGGMFDEETGHVHEYEGYEKVVSREPNEEEKRIIQKVREYNYAKKGK